MQTQNNYDLEINAFFNKVCLLIMCFSSTICDPCEYTKNCHETSQSSYKLSGSKVARNFRDSNPFS